MKTKQQQELLTELLELEKKHTHYQDEDCVESPVMRYKKKRFEAELEMFKRVPLVAMHGSKISRPGDYVAGNFCNIPLLFTRDSNGSVHGFLNVCRHRGAAVVPNGEGCKNRFSCPYHAWTYDNLGNLVGVPHETTGFPDIKRSEHNLVKIDCVEKHGWIWFRISGTKRLDVDAWLSSMTEDISLLDGSNLKCFDTFESTYNCNWKLMVEGGLEAYHFAVAHRKTIAHRFIDNLSTYQTFDRHIRSIIARNNLSDLNKNSPNTWKLKNHAAILYTVFPTTQWVQNQDHIFMIQFDPKTSDQTRVKATTLIRQEEDTKDREDHWRFNHALTVETLKEDFSMGESIQRGLDSGANNHFTIGRFEGALAYFNKQVELELNNI